MYNLVSLKVRARNHRSLEGCFSGMTLIPVPIYGGQNVLKTFEMAIQHGHKCTNGIRKSFLSLDFFPYDQNVFF